MRARPQIHARRQPAELEREFARAAAAGKFVLLDYYADWCADCARMKKTTFRDARVAALLDADFVALQVDVTDPRDAGGKALKKRFGVFGRRPCCCSAKTAPNCRGNISTATAARMISTR